MLLQVFEHSRRRWVNGVEAGDCGEAVPSVPVHASWAALVGQLRSNRGEMAFRCRRFRDLSLSATSPASELNVKWLHAADSCFRVADHSSRIGRTRDEAVADEPGLAHAPESRRAQASLARAILSRGTSWTVCLPYGGKFMRRRRSWKRGPERWLPKFGSGFSKFTDFSQLGEYRSCLVGICLAPSTNGNSPPASGHCRLGRLARRGSTGGLGKRSNNPTVVFRWRRSAGSFQ